MSEKNKQQEEEKKEQQAPNEEELTEEDVEILGPEDVEEDELEEESGSREAELEKEIEEWKNRALRTQADLENVRRRAKAEKEEDAKYRVQPLAEDLLPVMDNFERAMQTQPDNESAQSFIDGMAMVYNQFRSALEQQGVEEIPAQGEYFDPTIHQAVMQADEEGFESNQIVEEMQKGYRLKDRVLRPSMVKVNN
ncbi:nucleotide exchange factor GrpE [Marinococcus sp. PL1-022]|uniref:nucleotide exchange factor GrpE n=1 Tax=Marinococcus sp. PL1-022 TaxID=3095363 RepID=UPI0029C4F5B8|nr:nucleotide exchange factor GrpE [Marinococcus sp. PL1-022]MDX6153342.1 nucleotide exchange factor GrpE [Marinococcus sp. PL1-022]